MMLYRTTLHSMLPLYVGTELGFSTTQIGTLFGITGVCVIVMIIPAGIITDKLGRKFATVPSTALPAIAFAAYPFSDSMLQLSILSALLGMSNGLSLGSVATSTYDVIPRKSRGQLQGLRRTIGDIGGIIGPLVGGVIANAYSPETTFIIYFPMLLLAAGLLAFAARETLGRSHPD
ncbi:MAG: MFS transporter [Deltaproteobacteria bacterium]|nr:MFS transporter [Deltaproteobacteria bacterium]